MSAVLTKGSTLKCANQGTVTLIPTQSKLTVSGQAAMVDGDLSGALISACQTVTDPQSANLQCLSVAAATGGVAAKLTVSGKGVLLKEIQGQTKGTLAGIAQTWSVTDAGQTKLKAV
jgi:hypothetical protein